ncbi:MAG: hypothetical protein A2W90_15005 [Bacteroidetes bacterium GWF2_42_66]|nr:MAG: hypothetical protein A2W92_15465 [Bacteroidetes bacterium GWA2_42_15]OFX99813.1 MAG: hypothetical protein A2W89_07225 [Bacteroidetes bacterium GWE2_42_39]OFY46623.1 MAG: hypothetical protein A2W90_15005 [Bacteroidetes bacterium GWF2_42_66]HAZ02711.1 hypothetical protein [Marinilabiliales bacterium]HBL74743.1 hypothetical protein [Prolixibacteraceae bacterium]
MDKERIIQFVTGNISDESEKNEIINWIDKDNANKQYFIQIKNIYALSRKSNGKIDMNAEYLKLQRKTGIISIKYISEFIKYAAVIIIAISLTWFIQERFYNAHWSETGQMNEVICPAGQISELILSDGTKIWLNSESRISYPSHFNRKQRSVELDGEAYFEVQKDKDCPFFVKTKTTDIKVLGTSFNVDAYNKNRFIETTLVEGKVVLQNKSGAKITEITPGQLASYDIDNRKIYLTEVDTRFYSSWKEGKMTFFNQPLEAIVLKLERWYNVKFTFNNEEIKSYRFSGVILKYKPFDQVMQIIKLSSPIDYKINLNPEYKNEIILSKLN